VNDILFSTVNNSQAVYVSISSFTSAGYSTLNGEMINNPKVSYSSFSTAVGIPVSQNFTSSIPFNSKFSTSGFYLSTSGSDLYMNSISFDGGHIPKYVNTKTFTTNASIEYFPNIQFPIMVNPGYDYPNPPLTDFTNNQTIIKPVISYVQATYGANTYIFPESSNLRFINSQRVVNLSNYYSTTYLTNSTTYVAASNFFTDTIKMNINPYTISSFVGSNLPLSTNFQVWHMISSGAYLNNGVTSNIGFPLPVALNASLPSNTLFLTINNQIYLPGA
jgi:hypothetical protein